jgi:DNA-binding YbaB/EbfC family protein
MNMQAMMAQAQKMQRDITKKKEAIDNSEFEGKSEWVEVVFMGNKKMKSLKIIKDGTIDEDDKEILEDMLNIAINDALAKIDKEVEKQLGSYGQGLSGLF